MPLQLKTVKVADKDYAELSEGKPVYVQDDGSDLVFDAPMAFSKIAQLTKESEKYRKSSKELDDKLKAFEGIEDPEAARAALEKIGALSEGEHKTAEQIEEIRRNAQKAAEERIAAATKTAQKQIEELQKQSETLQTQLYEEKIGGSFSRSKFITDRVAPGLGDLVQSKFRNNFKVEEGKIVAYDSAGAKIPSRKSPGEFADFEEALEILVDTYPNKDNILKGKGGGSGGKAGTGGGQQGEKTISRAEFDKLEPLARMQTMRTGVKVVDAV